MVAPAGATEVASVAERYRSLFAIGKGGMGSVEVALERAGTSFERIVALKRLLPEAARDPRRVEMFLREARLAALLSHPNVVHAFDFGELHGELFLAMEYVEGETLSHVVRAAYDKEGRLAPAIVAHVLADVCDGLHAAHELRDVNGTPLNVVHRDVSPHNVMIAFEGHVKLLDFGVAKIEGERGVTKTGEVKGKTAYMSPEQAMGDALDRRSDLYAVGAILFECLTGRRMWGDGTDMEVLRRLALEEPPRVEDAAPEAPRRLCELQRRLVAQRREERPESARVVSEELRAFIAETKTRPDARVIGAVMARLFPDETDARKRRLNDALEAVVSPVRANALRATLGSGAPVKLPDAPPATSDVKPPATAIAPAGARRPVRRALLVAPIAVLLGGVGAIALLKAAPRTETAAALPVPQPPASPPTVSAAAPAPPPPAAVEPTPPAASQQPRPSPVKAARPAPRPSTVARPAASPPASAPTKPLDVDPNAVP